MLHASAAPGTRARSVTATRTESQFSVSPSALPDFVAALRSRLVQRPCPPEGLLVTTVYFDTPWGSLLEQCRAGGYSERLRLREYPAASATSQPQYWIELKRRLGQHSEKERRPLDPADAAGILRDPLHATEAFQSLANETRSAPLVPTLVGQYRRLSFADEGCRVTLDRTVSFFSPLLAVRLPLSNLGERPVAVEPDITLEVKVTGSGPTWLDALVGGLPRQPQSKFVRGSHALAAAARP